LTNIQEQTTNNGLEKIREVFVEFPSPLSLVSPGDTCNGSPLGNSGGVRQPKEKSQDHSSAFILGGMFFCFHDSDCVEIDA